MRFDPELIVSDPDKSLYEGVLDVWGKSTSYWYVDQIKALERNFRFDAHTPWKDLDETIKTVILYGSGDTRLRFDVKRSHGEFKFQRSFEGVIPNLERRYHETKSEDMQIWMERFMSNQVCDECGGKRLRPEVLAVKVADRSISDLTSLSIRDAHAFFRGVPLNETEKKYRPGDERAHRQARILNDVGIEY
jgi:excinuclease ABC subunit A